MVSRAPHQPLLDDDQSFRERITESLRASLIAGDMRPGRVYSAPSLALEFGVSATPVREALLSLAKEGLVEAVRNKGFRVRELSDRELDDFTQIRALIEVPVMRSLAGSVAAEVLESYRGLSQEIVDAAKRGSVVDYVDSLMGAGFTVNNPNAVSTCGCGHSFRTAGDTGDARSCGCGH